MLPFEHLEDLHQPAAAQRRHKTADPVACAHHLGSSNMGPLVCYGVSMLPWAIHLANALHPCLPHSAWAALLTGM